MLLYWVGELPSNGRRAAGVAEAAVAAVAVVVSLPNFLDISANTFLVY